MSLQQTIQSDDARVLSFIDQTAFGILVYPKASGMTSQAAPYYYAPHDDTLGQIYTHLPNTTAAVDMFADGEVRLILAVQGPHAYLSPSWYATSRTAPKWGFLSAEASGTARLLPSSQAEDYFRTLLTKNEAAVRGTYVPTASMLRQLSQSALPIALTIESVRGESQLNQAVGQDDHIAIVANLLLQRDRTAHALARAMDDARSTAIR